MNIRKATLVDVDRIREIAEITWPVTYSEIISAEQIEFMLNWMYSKEKIKEAISDEKQDFLVLEMKNDPSINSETIVGFAGIEHHYQSNAITRIHKLYVLPSTQGTGAGKALFNAIIEEAKANDSTLLHLNVNKANKAVSFYQHLGFHVHEEEVLDIGKGFVMDDYVMVKGI